VSSWLSTGLQVAEVAANIMGRLLVAEPRPQGWPLPPYAVGTVQWYFDDRTSRLWAFNAGTEEAALNYAVASPESSLSVLQPLPAHQSYDATEDFGAFTQGRLAVAPSTILEAAQAGGRDRVVAFTISALAFGVTARILTGVEISIGRDLRTGLYTARISSPTVSLRAVVRATDVRGNSVSARGDLGVPPSPGTGVNELDIELPPGVDLSPVVQRLTVELEMPASLYTRATAERRQLLLDGMPPLARGTAAAGSRLN